MKHTFQDIIRPTWGSDDVPRELSESSGTEQPWGGGDGGTVPPELEPDELFLTSGQLGEEDSSEDEDGREGDDCAGAPSIEAATAAWKDLTTILSPRRKSGIGHNPFEGDEFLRERLLMLKMHLSIFIDPNEKQTWISASLKTASVWRKSSHTAKKLREWAQSFIADRADLPRNLYGAWNVSLLHKGELAKEIQEHLQSIGKYIKAMDITPSGQYVDGHEREDVTTYRQEIFLPTIAELEWNLRRWKDGIEEMTGEKLPRNRRTVIWWHDESTFYAHDRRLIYWVPKDATAVPRQKGEGASLMVADFVSADYGWLRFEQEEARVLFRADKARDGYFTNEDILAHAETAMSILDKHFPNEKHVFIFDNATTHLKRADDSLSARRMPKFPTKPGAPLFGVDRKVVGDDGKPIYGPDGKVLKTRVRMADAQFADGTPQSLYFPPGHEREGVFKGMAVILEERGITDAQQLRAECPKFRPKDVPRCCCRWVLYNQPDFVDVESLLETTCKGRGYEVYFLPKFHCELNFIEQCWGHAKRTYRKNPTSSSEADLERNVIAALDAVPLVTMRKFSTRAFRFMDAYCKGLSGKQAAWASKKYRGHRVLPNSILQELERAGI
ncbi:hypothetical protein GLOTRDRAFT_108476 [Gloeophyllum trabeum ATCC 11539]|uniref:Uncharacterized protein n=1 Tax=Gloeophyllum trabeum (strain ATCC 11539 / FP-39264 / Madison 617) TaxID=670483 RepID=S7PSQ6_GLOTA|nr:uncharacterized protein GLOTRDRAFT_108476 [Gloeophyllum trabeum ATCC 11539]EPQ50851.1 hypothetical protein GLOTRDRAFT_108476 [Gloeophyllum trabeum ATCC 11539]